MTKSDPIWEILTPSIAPRQMPIVSAIDDAQVMILGGVGDDSQYLSDVTILNTDDNSFKPVLESSRDRGFVSAIGQATMVKDCKVLAVGMIEGTSEDPNVPVAISFVYNKHAKQQERDQLKYTKLSELTAEEMQA